MSDEEMNYRDFMLAIEAKLATMSDEEKTLWIYNQARVSSASQRRGFLESLDDRVEHDSISYDADAIEQWFQKIEDAEICFKSEYYETYDSFWGSDNVDFYDPDGIIGGLNHILDISERLLYLEQYDASLELNTQILTATFTIFEVTSEDQETYSIDQLPWEIGSQFNMRKLIRHLCYASYQTMEGSDRAQAIYEYLSWNEGSKLKLEDIFSTGPEELQNIDTFMAEWTSLLINTSSDRAAELLREACLYNGLDYLSEVAVTCCRKHPLLAKYVCQELLDQKRYAECEKLGLEVIRLLPENLLILAEIADLTATAALELDHPDEAERCYQTMFYARSSMNNYLRLFQLAEYEAITKKGAQYALSLPEHDMPEFNYKNKQMQVNKLNTRQKDAIRFFSGDVDSLYDKYEPQKQSLGWTYDAKGTFVPLFILLLNDSEQRTAATQRLAAGVISDIGFEGDAAAFLDLFIDWRTKQTLSEEQYKKYKEWLLDEVDRRTEGIVGGGHRKSYYKAAVLIAALGEALESRGMENGRAVLIEHYRALHTRKWAFKAEFEQLRELSN